MKRQKAKAGPTQSASRQVRQRQPKRWKAKIIKDPRTGSPVLSAGPGAPKITQEKIRKLLADFP